MIVRGEVEAAVNCLGESVDRTRALRHRNYYAPEGGFQLMNDVTQLVGPGNDWRLSPVMHAYVLAAAQLGAADDHLVGLETLLLEGSVSIAPFVVARAAIEAIGRASLFLDPGISPRERARLAFAERRHELTQLKPLVRAAKHLNPSDETGPPIEARIQEIVEEAQGFGRIPKRPDFTQAARRALAIDRADHGIAEAKAAMYSAIAHAVPNALLGVTYQGDARDQNPHNVGFLELSDSVIVALVSVVLGAYLRAVSLQVGAYGWPPSSLDRWWGHVRAVLRRASASLAEDWRIIEVDEELL